MDLNLRGKNAFVTGSTRGIGKAIAQFLHDEGCKVLLNSRNDYTPEQGYSFVKADVCKTQDFSKIKSAIKTEFNDKLDILICNVGSGRSVPAGNETLSEWQSSLEVNFFSATNVIEELRYFLTPQVGSILCISSICGLEILNCPLTYTVAKAALNTYVVGLSKVVSQDGIRINVLAPGNILFPGSVWERKLKDDPKAVQLMLDKEVALKRLGKIEEIASVATFLVSERASFMTGGIFVADGGQLRSW